jgi:cysteine protease ATG4
MPKFTKISFLSFYFRQLPRTIFSVQDEQPTWPSDSDDNMGLESISEPDDIDLDEEGDGFDGENEQFFDTQSSSGSNAHRRGKSSEFDTEEDPVGPVTPGPNSRFEMRDPSMSRKGGVHDDEDDEDEDDADGSFLPDDGRAFDDEDDDIEDDWVDPSVPTPTEAPATAGPTPPLPPAKNSSRSSVNSSSPPSASNVPPLAKSKSSRSASSSAAAKQTSGKPKSSAKGKKETPVPVPAVRIPSQQPAQEHYPFPVTPADDPSASPQHDRPRNSSTKGGKRMHTARARDGGRTQSGGVKGILTDD